MYDYDFHTYSVKKRRSRGKIVFNFFGVILLVALLFWFVSGVIGKNTVQKPNTDILSAESQQETDESDNSTLGAVVKQALIGANGSYSVVIKNLKTGESYYLNQHRVYESGSLYKLWIMAVVFDQINSGKLKKDAALIADVERLNKKFSIASDSAE